MRQFMIATAMLMGIVAQGFANPGLERPSDEPKADAKLAVGDVPPNLKASKWLQGNPVERFEAGRIYVVEFWATWCGPCVAVMPHVADMQKEYADKGVTVIGFTAADPSNTAEKVAKFIEKRGPRLGYTFAFADNRDTYDAYMKAAKQNGIPCSYVIGKDGKLAFIGHPAFLDYVLPRVVAGTWDAKEGAAEVARADADFDKTFAAVLGPDVDKGMKAMAELEEKRPYLAESTYFVAPRIAMLIKAKKLDAARAAAEKAVKKAVDQEDPYLLHQLASGLRVPAAREDKTLLALAVRAADSVVKLEGDQDARALLGAAEAHTDAGEAAQAKEYAQKAVKAAEAALAKEGNKPTTSALLLAAEAQFAAGDAAKAREYGQKAVDTVENPRQKEAIKKMTEKFDEKKPDGGK